EAQTLTFSGSPASGTFTLQYGPFITSGPITYNTTAGALTTAIQNGLNSMFGANNTFAQQTGGSSPNFVYTIWFTGQLAGVDMQTMTVVSALNAGTVVNAASADGAGAELQRLTFSSASGALVTGGNFILNYGTLPSQSIAYDPNPAILQANVQAGLDAMFG